MTSEQGSVELPINNVRCAVCEKSDAPALFMLPGSTSCDAAEYTGYLFTVGSQHICLDVALQDLPSIEEGSNGEMVSVTVSEDKTESGGFNVEGEPLACAVCSINAL